MEQEERDPIRETEVVVLKADHRFSKGVITGVLSTLGVAALLAAAAVFWLQGRFSTGGTYEGVSANIVDSSVRSKINDLTAVIKAYYYEEADEEDLTEGLYKGLFASLGDPYSAYYTPVSYTHLRAHETF